MSSKKQLALTLACANGMELDDEGTRLWATPAQVGVLVSKVSGKPVTSDAAQQLAIDAGWEDFIGDLRGSLDALCVLLDTACAMEVL